MIEQITELYIQGHYKETHSKAYLIEIGNLFNIIVEDINKNKTLIDISDYGIENVNINTKLLPKGGYRRIPLLSPFKESAKSVSITVTARDNRARVSIKYSSNVSRTMQYARYLLCVKSGRELSKYETADHIDEDKLNDNISNLQILSGDENTKKYKKYYNEKIAIYHKLVCPECNLKFKLTDRIFKSRKKTSKESGHPGRNFCSIKCSSKYNNKYNDKVNANRSLSNIKKILRLSRKGFSSYKIGEITGIHRSSVARYIDLFKNR